MDKEVRVSTRISGRDFIMPTWIREILGWKSYEVLFFRLRDTEIEVTKSDGYTTRMVKSRIHIPVDIARALNIKDGDIVELIPKEGGTLIIKKVSQK